MPSGPARARYPYDDAVASMAGRPAGLWMRPTLGFFQLGRQAAITVHPDAWRAVPRWSIWTPRDGLVPPVGLPAARPADLLTAAGSVDRRTDRADHRAADRAAPDESERARSERLRARLRDGHGDALQVLRDVLDLLDLPGAGLLSAEVDIADLPGARLVEPAARHARAFDRLVSEETRHRIEMEA